MKKCKQRMMALVLAAVWLLLLWPTGVLSVDAAVTYDPDAAIAYAAANWNSGVGLCAQFVSECLYAGDVLM